MYCLCRIETQEIQNTGPACVSFWYMMFGADISQLLVYTYNVGQQWPWLTISGPIGYVWLSGAVTVQLTNGTDKVGLCAFKKAVYTLYIPVSNLIIQLINNMCMLVIITCNSERRQH